jgi:hypothetical protein
MHIEEEVLNLNLIIGRAININQVIKKKPI